MLQEETKYHELRKKLNAREQKFVAEYLIDSNASRAAVKAGFSAHCPAELGYENLRKPLASVKRKQSVKKDGSVVTEVEFKLWDKIAALTLLGKRLKLWVEKVEIENPQAEAYRLLLRQLKTRQGESIE
jgi:phage terminase small subunit